MHPLLTFRRLLISALVTALAFGVTESHAGEPIAEIEGDVSADIRDLLKSVIGEADAPARSLAQARRQAKKAATQAQSVMRSQGYYGAQIETRINEPAAKRGESKRKPPKPVLKITSGPQFKFGKISVVYSGEPPETKSKVIDPVIIASGLPAIAAKVVTAERRAVTYLRGKGYPDITVQPRGALVDHDSQTMDVTFNLITGDKTRFGDIILTGDANIRKSWPKMIAPFKTGDLYDEKKLSTLSSRVISANAFESAAATLAHADIAAIDIAATDNTVTRNVNLHITQGKLNTISGEVGYSTTDGSGIDLSYSRRNFIGFAQTAKLTTSIKTNQFSLGAEYRIPYFGRAERTFDLGAEIAHEDTDAFTGERAGLNGLLTQKIVKDLKIGLGAGLEASRYKDNGIDVTAYLFEGLGRATYDSRDNLLDPTKGFRIEASAVPTYNFGKQDGLFTTAQTGASTYLRISDKLVAAGRVKAGTIFGASQDSVPLNRRFYGGGGGSVRGFGYQSISPLNAAGESIGGRSITEASAELRYHGESPFGVAAFIDAGSVTARDLPNLKDIRYGAGLGLRYHTSFAPLRADIAIPLNKRAGDNAFQIYISIGQAF